MVVRYCPYLLEVNSLFPLKGLLTWIWRILVPCLRDHLKAMALEGWEEATYTLLALLVVMKANGKNRFGEIYYADSVLLEKSAILQIMLILSAIDLLSISLSSAVGFLCAEVVEFVWKSKQALCSRKRLLVTFRSDFKFRRRSVAVWADINNWQCWQ